MHGKKLLVQDLYYGVDEANLYLRLDLYNDSEPQMQAMEARLTLQTGRGAAKEVVIAFMHGAARVADSGSVEVECAFGRVLEVRIPLAALGVEAGVAVSFQMSLWSGGLPMDAVPQQGSIRVATDGAAEWGG